MVFLKGQHIAEVADLLLEAQSIISRMIRDDISQGVESQEIKDKYEVQIQYYETTKTMRLFIEAFPPKVSAEPKSGAYKIARNWYLMLVNDAIIKGMKQGDVPTELTPVFNDRTIIFVRYHFPTERLKDVDNYDLKPLIDALRRTQVIRDDTYKDIKIIVEGVRAEIGGTEVIIADEKQFFSRCWNFDVTNLLTR